MDQRELANVGLEKTNGETKKNMLNQYITLMVYDGYLISTKTKTSQIKEVGFLNRALSFHYDDHEHPFIT